jgi:hypothetical protein
VKYVGSLVYFSLFLVCVTLKADESPTLENTLSGISRIDGCIHHQQQVHQTVIYLSITTFS